MSTLKTMNITDGHNSATLEQICRGIGKAWAVFNGIGTLTVSNSYNITSVTDVGVGQYTLNFIKQMRNPNYAYAGAGRWPNDASAVLVGQSVSQPKTASSLTFYTTNSTTGNATDVSEVTIIVYGD